MTLESDRPERGSDDRYNAPAFGVSGALPLSLENVLPQEHPLNLSILLSGGKEINEDCLSSGE